MKTRLNLASTPLQNNRRFLASSVLIGGFGIVALALLAMHAIQGWHSNEQLRKETAALESRNSNLERQQQELASFFQNPQIREDIDRSAFLNGIIEQRSFPWTKIFMDLEETLPAGVRVISIAPSLQNGRVEVKLVVGALSDESELKFLKALQESKVFSGVQVKQENHPLQAPNSQDRVLLELSAWYSTT